MPRVGKRFKIGIAQWEYSNDGTEDNPTDEGWVQYSRLTSTYYRYLDTQFRKYGFKKQGSVEMRKKWLQEEILAIRVTPIGAKQMRDADELEDTANKSEKVSVQKPEEKL